ncbi:MAG: tRNA (guanosine(37)-N1)-methyltransferase TrmD [Flavobacteriales bacterium]|nr:tRNA (guanosine(37)-N1)-methyltransferase TrmD [Flavobacteriales bacterium]
MRIDIITVLPELLSPLQHSIVKRAVDKGVAEIHVHDLRQFGIGNYKQVDDYPYGGGGGMVLKPEPLSDCLEMLLKERAYDEIIYLTPDGITLNQKAVNTLSLKNNICLICGHYKGIDQRIRDEYVTLEISIGDYVLSGGEQAAVILTDAIIRILPGAIGDEMSALSDSFQDNLLAPPVYTKPEIWKDRKVPEVLLSGNHKAIDEWRLEQALEITRNKRPDLL